jgi:hypothetical protein
LIENERNVVLSSFVSPLTRHPPTDHCFINLSSRPGPIRLANDVIPPASPFDDKLEVGDGRTAISSSAVRGGSVGLMSASRGCVDLGKVVVSFERVP